MIKYLITFLLSICIFGVVFAKNAEDKGIAIAQEVDQHDRGWGDAITSMKMVLRNAQGEKSMRTIRIKTLEVEDDGDKSLTIFDTPLDVKGSAFLSFSHAVKPDDQWLYLPALKRIKRISSTNKSGPFMGSQFAYEDLASFEVNKYHYKYLRDEILDKHDTFVVEYYPRYKYSGYTREIVWIDKKRYIPLQVQYYDRKNDLLKTLKLSDYKQHLGKYWRAYKQIMKNHQNNRSTTVTWNEHQFQTGLSVHDFKRNSLKRVK